MIESSADMSVPMLMTVVDETVTDRNGSVKSDSYLLKTPDTCRSPCSDEDDYERNDEEDDGRVYRVKQQPTVERLVLCRPSCISGKNKRKNPVIYAVSVVVICLIITTVIAVVILTTKRTNSSKLAEVNGDKMEGHRTDQQITLTPKPVRDPVTTSRTHPTVRLLSSYDNCSRVVIGDVENDVFVFKGLPYALPPVNTLRWKPPASYGLCRSKESLRSGQQSDDTYRAHSFGSECRQIRGVEQTGSEDCLYLNVWTPALAGTSSSLRKVVSTSGLNVMVYIHGGGLINGNGNEYDSSDISALSRDYNTVFITFNYRLNVFGFLSLSVLSSADKTNASGNYGYMDQILALRWVQENVKQFGGDPQKVTVFGQGSGATSIYALLATKESRSLFTKAWLASLSPKFENNRVEAELQNLEFLNNTVCRSLVTTRQYNCLLNLSTESVMAALPWNKWANGHFYSMPQLDESNTIIATIDGSLLESGPVAAWKNGTFLDIPLLIGSTAQETDVRASSLATDWTWYHYRDYMHQILTPFEDVVISEVLKLYPPNPVNTPITGSGNSRGAGSASSPGRMIATAVSDLRAVCPVDEIAKVAAHVSQSPVYRYVATFFPGCEDDVTENDGPSLRVAGKSEGFGGRRSVGAGGRTFAYSGSDLSAFFGTADATISSGAKNFSANMRKIIFDFVRHAESTILDWSQFPIVEYDVSVTIRNRTVRYASPECRFWREQEFYPKYTWIN